MLNFILIALIVCIVSPFVVYFCVKFGTFGYYRSRDLVKKYKEKEQEYFNKEQ